MREHAIAGPWAAGERVIVCLDPSAAAANAVRAAKRTADGLDAELIALYVETDRHAALSEVEHGHLAETMRLAAELGAEVVTIPGRSVVEEVLAFARSRKPRAWWSASRGARAGRIAPRLGGRRAGTQRLGARHRGGAVGRHVEDGDADRLAADVPRTPGPYLEGC